MPITKRQLIYVDILKMRSIKTEGERQKQKATYLESMSLGWDKLKQKKNAKKKSQLMSMIKRINTWKTIRKVMFKNWHLPDF